MGFRPDDALVIFLLGLILVAVVLSVSRAAWPAAAGATGFLLVTLGWIGMHFRLRRELPDHPLARMSYVLGPKRSRRRAFWSLLALHWQRHRLDAWTAVLGLGVLVLVGVLAWTAVLR